MSSIMVINAKGGSGKTTISTNLASYYASSGFKVTLVDLDPQGSASKWLSSRPITKAKIRGVTSLPPQKVSKKEDEIRIFDVPAAIYGARLQTYIKKARKISEVPNFWKYIANNPETLERIWSSMQQVMKEGALNSVTKELIYVAVSMTNSCEYCTRSHTVAAKKKGATDEMIKEMIDVVGMANQNNKLVEAYQVEVDDIYK